MSAERAAELDAARARLSALLPSSWLLKRDVKVLAQFPALRALSDELWTLGGPGLERAVLAVTRRPTVTRETVRDLAVIAQSLTPAPNSIGECPPTLVVSARWLSMSTREMLQDAGISYIDDTGNLDVRVTGLPVLLRTVGAQSNPSRRKTGKAGLRGNQALAVVRYLVDFMPPLSQSEIAVSTETTLGYVSKIVTALEQDGLVARDGGTVTEVVWAELLRERAAQAPPLLSETTYAPMIARRGLETTLAELPSTLEDTDDVWVTGSAAAQLIAPLAPTTQLTMRVKDPARVRRRLGLLGAPPDSSKRADVLLITTNYDIAVAGAERRKGLPVVAPSQLVLDCLTGTGRMPAEGEAVIEWMRDNPDAWRHPPARQQRRPSSIVASKVGVAETRSRSVSMPLEDSEPAHASPPADGWSREAVAYLVDRLTTEHPAQAQVLRAAAGSTDGVIDRDSVYEVAGYSRERSLRGFTRPITRLTSLLVRRNALGADAQPALSPIYDAANRASGFRLAPEVARLIREIDNTRPTGRSEHDKAPGQLTDPGLHLLRACRDSNPKPSDP